MCDSSNQNLVKSFRFIVRIREQCFSTQDKSVKIATILYSYSKSWLMIDKPRLSIPDYVCNLDSMAISNITLTYTYTIRGVEIYIYMPNKKSVNDTNPIYNLVRPYQDNGLGGLKIRNCPAYIRMDE